jgi:hypothetical protein
MGVSNIVVGKKSEVGLDPRRAGLDIAPPDNLNMMNYQT